MRTEGGSGIEEEGMWLLKKQLVLLGQIETFGRWYTLD